MIIIGYILGALIGLTMGLIGGGGSVLAVPVLAYIFTFDEKVATAYSLFIVGTTALFGGVRQHLDKQVDWKLSIIFGIPSIIGVSLTRYYLIPALPENILEIGSYAITRRMFMFGLLAGLMFLSAFSMLKDKNDVKQSAPKNNNNILIVLEGLVLGALTGLVGAGGGFLIIPALVILARLDIKKAVGTSLVIIALKSLIGFFIGDYNKMVIDWQFLSVFSLITIIGIFIGIYLSTFINSKKLKKGFGYFILAMALFIFFNEFFII